MNQVPRVLRVILFLCTVLLLYFVWKYVLPELAHIFRFFTVALTPFLMAVVLAVLIDPMVRYAQEKLRLKRPLAVACAMLLVVGGAGALAALLVLRLSGELMELSVHLPQTLGPLQAQFNRLLEQGKVFYFQLPPLVTQRLQENMGVFTTWLSRLAASLAGFLIHLVASLPSAVVTIIVALIATYFFSRDAQLITGLWLKVVPEPWGRHMLEVSRRVVGAAFGYLRAQTFLVTLTTLQSIVGLYLIGAKYALTVGLLVGLFDVIPVLGPATIYIPWAVWSFFTGKIAFGIKLLVLYLLVWGVRQVLEARVVAAHLGLHPLAVMVAMYVGLKAVGVLGLVLGPLTLIALKATLNVVGPFNHGGNGKKS